MKATATVSACLALSGCLTSQDNLFDRSHSFRPLIEGRYTIEEFKEGKWKTSEPAFLTTKDGSYVVSVADRGPLFAFDLYPISKRFWTFYQKRDQDPGWYFLIEPRDGAYYLYEPQCSDYLRAEKITAAPNEPVATYCDFSSREKLIPALLSAATVTQPSARITLASKGERPPAPAPEVGTEAPAASPSATTAANSNIAAEDPLFTLSVCNKSSTALHFIAFHRHWRHDVKWLLNGWYQVNNGACREIRIPRGYFYISADGENGQVWSGKDRYLCIMNRAIERVVFENERCLAGETNRGFIEVFNSQDKFIYNLVDK